MNDTSPLISVITIVKNNEKLLPRAISSVLQQSFNSFEYIIINDGSSDSTKEIIDSYKIKDVRIKSINKSQNIGRAMARNIGLDTAIGKYLLFLDSDDYLPQNTLNELYIIAQEKNADIVYGRLKCFDSKNGNWIERHYTDRIINHEKHNFRLDDYLDLVDNHHIIGRLYKTSLIKKNKIKFSKKRKNGEDVLFSFHTAYKAKNISMVPRVISYYYSLGNYLNAANENKLFDARDNIIDTIDFSVKNGSSKLKNRMLYKGAIFAGSLDRAQIVFGKNDVKFEQYLESLLPLVDRIPENIINELPIYFSSFTKKLKSEKYSEALSLWNQKIGITKLNKTEIYNVSLKNNNEKNDKNRISYFIKEIEHLRDINIKLASQLEVVYKSKSWRITEPLRRIVRIANRKRIRINTKSKKIQYKRKATIPQTGLDLSFDLQNGGFGKHRSGWKFALKSLKSLHNPEGLYMVSFLEKVFLWNNNQTTLFPRPWIGFTHRPHNIPSWFPSEMKKLFYQNKSFKNFLPNCIGIFTLSEYHKKHISKKLSVPVENLVHPTEIPNKLWNPKTLSKKYFKVVQIGWWLRNLHGIFMLPSGEYEKIYLTKKNVEKPVNKIFNIERKFLNKKGLFNDSMYETAKTIDFLSNEKYDDLLAGCIVFLNLYDASANNSIIECIARTTPVLVNPLESVVEYLGKDYPLYYENMEEASEKLHNKELLMAGHEYLKTCPTRSKLSGEFFSESLQKSKIYSVFYQMSKLTHSKN